MTALVECGSNFIYCALDYDNLDNESKESMQRNIDGQKLTFRYDSTHGCLGRDNSIQVSIVEGKLNINGQHVAVYSERDPKNIPWGAAGKFF